MYILECVDGSYYTGSTKDLERGLWEHQNMLGANYTKKRLPVKLVYFEEYSRIDEAFYREKQVQGWSHKKKKALIDGDFDNIHYLAECKNDSHFKNRLFRLRSTTDSTTDSTTNGTNLEPTTDLDLESTNDSTSNNGIDSTTSGSANSGMSLDSTNNKQLNSKSLASKSSLSSEECLSSEAETNGHTKNIKKVVADE